MKKFLIILILLSLAACGPGEPSTPRVEDIQTAIAETQAAQPTATHTPNPPTTTPLPLATPTPYQTSTPTPSGPINVSVTAAFLNLRAGPSTLFGVVETFESGAAFEAIARSSMGDWILVRNADQTEGWFTSVFLDFEGDLLTLPVMDYPVEQSIQGYVRDTEGNGISGITIAVIFRDADIELRTDVATLDDGYFITYYPADLLGILDVQIVGINCNSPVMDDACQLSEYFELEGRAFIEIPQAVDIIFQYETATTILTGTVRNASNRLLSDILIVAERDDGAESVTRSDANGEFSLPIGEGIWEVYAVTFDPRKEGSRLTVEITNQQPPILELVAP